MQTKHDDIAAELSRLDAGQEYAKLRSSGVPAPDAIQRVIKQMIDPHAPQPEDIHQEMQMFENPNDLPTPPQPLLEMIGAPANRRVLRDNLKNLPAQRLFDIPPEYLPDLKMPNQRGTMPTTPHPLEDMQQMLEEEVYPSTDAGIGEAYDDALRSELLRGKIPGHLYGWTPKTPETPDYSQPPGFPPLGGANQGWYPGSGPIDPRGDMWDDIMVRPNEEGEPQS